MPPMPKMGPDRYEPLNHSYFTVKLMEDFILLEFVIIVTIRE